MEEGAPQEEKKSARPRRVAPKRLQAPVESAPMCAPHALAPWGVAVAAVIVLALVVFGVIARTEDPVDPSWHAAFLTNGQVYFGHVLEKSRDTIALANVYYLQATPSLQQREPGEPAPPPDVALVKLGSELHGPLDTMWINREHILFTETLRDDSPVVQAITAALAAEQASATPAADEQAAPSETPDTGEEE
ncbi:MAG: hypothetical protein Q7T01_01775 [bacterium]|nr:hypothetical protein [bacterium]